MVKAVHELSQRFPRRDETDYERLGAARFSLYNDYGHEKLMEELIKDYKDFYKDKINENKNKIVTSYLEREFNKIYPIMKTNEALINSNF